jgi:opacity protein-like surface antigen
MNRIAMHLLAATALIAAGAEASAADLSGGLRGPSVVTPLAEPAASSSGWYLRGDVGVGISPQPDLYSQETNVPKSFIHRDLADAPFIGAGIGYQFNDYLRADLTGEYHGSRRLRGTAFYQSTYSGRPSHNYASYDGDLRTFAVMANAYIDLGSYWGVTPYVGGGIGAAYNRLSTIKTATQFMVSDNASTFANPTPQPASGGYMPARGEWSFAWALHTGMTWDVSPRFKVDLGYSYKDLGKVTSGQAVCYDYTTCDEKLKVKNIIANDLHLGVRYLLNPPTRTPVYTPVVAKY